MGDQDKRGLHRAERLSEEFQRSLPGWVHSGFSVHGEQTVSTEDVQGAERLARYLTRGPLPIDVVEKVEGGRLRGPKNRVPLIASSRRRKHLSFSHRGVRAPSEPTC